MPALELVPLDSIVPTPYYIERSGPSERSLSYPVRAPLFYRAHASQYTISPLHRPVSPPSLAVLLFRRTMTTGAAEARARPRVHLRDGRCIGEENNARSLARSYCLPCAGLRSQAAEAGAMPATKASGESQKEAASATRGTREYSSASVSEKVPEAGSP